ncbi:uncharacterized protein METZ01_LOCUS360800, partial [marine metagenome]
VQFQDKNKKFKTYLSSGDIVGEIGELKKFRDARAFAYSDDVYTVRLNQNELERVFKLFPSFYGTVYKKIKKLEATLS